MSRTKKLLIVGLVLVSGIMLALPFRKLGSQQPAEQQTTEQQIATLSPATTAPGFSQRQNTPNRHVAAKIASLGDHPRPPATEMPTTSFDLANHPAFTSQLAPARTQPVTPQQRPVRREQVPPVAEQGIRPTYRTVESPEELESKWPREVVHEVQDGDTLEELADHYLGDAARALEIFDMNRDKLANPHQLPIGAELLVPVAPGRLMD